MYAELQQLVCTIYARSTHRIGRYGMDIKRVRLLDAQFVVIDHSLDHFAPE